MSLRFSRVTLFSDGKTTSFLVGGMPHCRTDLQGWTAYDNFVFDIQRYTAVNARADTFLYGDDGEECEEGEQTSPQQAYRLAGDPEKRSRQACSDT